MLSYSPVISEPYHNACCFWSLPFSGFPRTLIREKHKNLEPALWAEANFITEQTDACKSQQMALRANCFLFLFWFAPGPNLIIRLLHFEFPYIILVIYGLWNDIFPLDILCIIFHVVVVLGLRHWFFRNGEQALIQFYWSLYAIFVNGANLLDFWERVDDVFMVLSKLSLPVHNFVQYLETVFAELSEILSE